MFAAAAALVCQVHLIFWPMYLVFALVAGLRLTRRDTQAPGAQVLAVSPRWKRPLPWSPCRR
jgi:hypothetical protein